MAGSKAFRTIQSVQRSFAILEFLNLRNGATQREVCEETKLSRGTAYRMLETMRLQGFLRKDDGSARYWLTGRVRALADGYVEEWWIEQFARQIVQALGRKIRWPVKLLTPSHNSMLARVTTDYESPLTEAKFPSGHRIGLLSTAAGRVYLAACDQATQDVLIRATDDAALRSASKEPSGGRMTRTEITKMIQRVRHQGYEIVNHRRLAIYSLAAPVVAGEQVLGAIVVQLFRASVPRSQAVAKLLPELNAAAKAIGDRFKATVWKQRS